MKKVRLIFSNEKNKIHDSKSKEFILEIEGSMSFSHFENSVKTKLNCDKIQFELMDEKNEFLKDDLKISQIFEHKNLKYGLSCQEIIILVVVPQEELSSSFFEKLEEKSENFFGKNNSIISSQFFKETLEDKSLNEFSIFTNKISSDIYAFRRGYIQENLNINITKINESSQLLFPLLEKNINIEMNDWKKSKNIPCKEIRNNSVKYANFEQNSDEKKSSSEGRISLVELNDEYLQNMNLSESFKKSKTANNKKEIFSDEKLELYIDLRENIKFDKDLYGNVILPKSEKITENFSRKKRNKSDYEMQIDDSNKLNEKLRKSYLNYETINSFGENKNDATFDISLWKKANFSNGKINDFADKSDKNKKMEEKKLEEDFHQIEKNHNLLPITSKKNTEENYNTSNISLNYYECNSIIPAPYLNNNNNLIQNSTSILDNNEILNINQIDVNNSKSNFNSNLPIIFQLEENNTGDFLKEEEKNYKNTVGEYKSFLSSNGIVSNSCNLINEKNKPYEDQQNIKNFFEETSFLNNKLGIGITLRNSDERISYSKGIKEKEKSNFSEEVLLNKSDREFFKNNLKLFDFYENFENMKNNLLEEGEIREEESEQKLRLILKKNQAIQNDRPNSNDSSSEISNINSINEKIQSISNSELDPNHLLIDSSLEDITHKTEKISDEKQIQEKNSLLFPCGNSQNDFLLRNLVENEELKLLKCKLNFQHNLEEKEQNKYSPIVQKEKIRLLTIRETKFLSSETKIKVNRTSFQVPSYKQIIYLDEYYLKEISELVKTKSSQQLLEENKNEGILFNSNVKFTKYTKFFSIDNFPEEDSDFTDGIEDINNLMNKISLNNQDKLKSINRIHNNIPVLRPIKEDIQFSILIRDLHKNLNSLPMEIFMRRKESEDKKINLILDIDSTLIHAINYENSEEIKTTNDNLENSQVFGISIIFNEKNYNLKFKIRKFVIEFLQICDKFCNLYICTHGVEPYAKEVVKILNAEAKINIQNENIVANKADNIQSQANIMLKTLKSFSQDQHFQDHSIILDDNIQAWEPQYRENIILSKKYLAFFEKELFDEQQQKYLENLLNGPYRFCYQDDKKNIFELKEIYYKLYDSNNCPHSVEYNFSKEFQMKYMIDTIKNIFKLSHYLNCTSKEALNKIRRNILYGYHINLENYVFQDDKLKKDIVNMIYTLGGQIDSSDLISSHYIISKLKYNHFMIKTEKSDIFKTKNYYIVNIKWLIDSYFSICKMDEKNYRNIDF